VDAIDMLKCDTPKKLAEAIRGNLRESQSGTCGIAGILARPGICGSPEVTKHLKGMGIRQEQVNERTISFHWKKGSKSDES